MKTLMNKQVLFGFTIAAMFAIMLFPQGQLAYADTLILFVDGDESFDDKNQKSLFEMGKTSDVVSSDDNWFETEAGFFTKYAFTNSLPAGATIDSVIISIEHYEEDDFSGPLVWSIDDGATAGVPALTLFIGEGIEGTDTLDVTLDVTTAGALDALTLKIINDDIGGKKDKSRSCFRYCRIYTSSSSRRGRRY